MILDINNIGTTGTRTNHSKANNAGNESKAPGSSPTTKPAVSGSDIVVLSQQAQTVARLQSNIASSQEVDLDKVAAIKQAIADGKFDFNPERIAENMLNQEDLLG